MAAAVLAAATVGRAQTNRPRLSDEDLKALVESADLIVQFRIDSADRTGADPNLVWEAAGPVQEVLKGTLEAGKISVHVDSFVRSFDRAGSELAGREYVAALKPLGIPGSRRFRIDGRYALAADGDEAQAVRAVAQGSSRPRAAGRPDLRLTVRPEERVFLPSGPKMLEVRLTNDGPEPASYVQAPLVEHDGKLYLPGAGAVLVRDASGSIVPHRGNVLAGQAPPRSAKPRPAIVFPKTSFTETIDLSKYYDLPLGRYTLLVSLGDPEGRGRIVSNGTSFQVGAVDLPETLSAPPVRPSPAPPAERSLPALLPDPNQYKPGEPRAGLAVLLRPERPVFEVGKPVHLEVRLLNTSERTVTVDVRLERTLTFQVTPVAASPPPTSLRNAILWPPDAPAMPDARAYLRGGAFWGRTIDINWYFGKQEKDLPRREDVAAGKDLSYERFGHMLFAFNQPGTYRIRATYRVTRPPPLKDAPAEAAPVNLAWWVGDADSNPVLIRIAEPSR
jgi:hypothetical protein